MGRLIDADELKDALDYIDYGQHQYDLTMEAIDSAPTIEERKVGEWFDNANVYDRRANKHDYFCLECKTHAMDFICGSEDWWCGKAPKYCPNCGAKMKGVE
jgi:hypothetical protein